MEDRPYYQFNISSARMDTSVPPNQVKPGSFGRLVGVDGRFNGALRNYYGNKLLVDLDAVSGLGDIGSYNGPDFVRQVTFQKRTTSTVYRGFVIRWDSQNDTTNEQIDLIYTTDNGSNWSTLAIWAAGNDITSSLEIDCTVDRGYLLVAVDTKTTKTVYWNGSALVTVDSGPGNFDSELAAPTFNTSAVDTSYQLQGDGTYQIAWRFYSSTRGIYSALSAPLTVRLDHIKTTKATGTVSFSSSGGDSGLLIDGDLITINGRTYEADDDSSYAGDVQVDISGLTTIFECCQALADAINSDSSAVVTASAQSASVLLESKVRGTAGNAYTLTKTENGANQDDITVSGSTLTGGGVVTSEPETQVKITIDLPDNDEVVSGEEFSDFDALFDTIDIFRTINLGDANVTQGAIFYLEQSISKTGNWATSGTWDALTVNVGTVVDSALPFLTFYDPEKDIVTAPPQSGTIGRYEGQTYMAEAASENGGYNTLFSSSEHASPEYFSTYNKRIGNPEEGRALRFLPAGESLFQLNDNAIVYIFKSGKLKPIQFTGLHKKRGLAGKEAAHSSGNSIFMISGVGLCMLNGSDGSMGAITAADRIIFDDWKSDISNIKSGYDSLMNASFFLNVSREEMLVIWHSTKVCTMIEGANFVEVTDGTDIVSGKKNRCFFITQTGRIVYPDVLSSGSGTMWDISSSYTLDGTATATSSSTLTDENAMLNSDMVGAKLYMTSGANAGEGRTIATIDNTTKVITFTSNFDNDISTGDTYSISPVPFSVRFPPPVSENITRFNRWVMAGVSLKARKLSGFDNNVNNKWRVGAYRNSSSSLHTNVAYPSVDTNPSESAEDLNIDGVDIELYVEQISAGTIFELTDAEVNLTLTDSRKMS
ncbi:MAG: hypothetical protein PVI43_00645 [Candidatus Bathyarchaeota archaeon]|jgi:hypothetical protein